MPVKTQDIGVREGRKTQYIVFGGKRKNDAKGRKKAFFKL